VQTVLEERLAEYNESHAAMDLVLFEQAMDHICRIARVLNLPRGNAMLVRARSTPTKLVFQYQFLWVLLRRSFRVMWRTDMSVQTQILSSS
jgi:hypothetical protein